MTTTTTRTRSAERTQLLGDLVVTAIENYGYGQFETLEYEPDLDSEPGEPHAEIRWYEKDENGQEQRTTVTLDTMARGLGIIRKARLDDSGEFLVNADTGERLFFGGSARDDLLLADRTNGEDGDVDVIGALAVLECAVFGVVVYG